MFGAGCAHPGQAFPLKVWRKVVDARSGHAAETFSRGARKAAFVTEGSPALSRSARESVSH